MHLHVGLDLQGEGQEITLKKTSRREVDNSIRSLAQTLAMAIGVEFVERKERVVRA